MLVPFYAKMRVVLPSNSSLSNFPENSLTGYTVKLSAPLDFSIGQWECGLSEIQFFKSWLNVTECWINIKAEDKNYKIIIPDGYYNTVNDLISSINENIALYTSSAISKAIDFKYNSITRKTRLIITPEIEGLEFNPNDKLSAILGITKFNRLSIPTMSEKFVFDGTETAKLKSNYNIMVYCDIIQSSSIGDTEAPLLRAVSVDIGQWQNQCTIYQRIQYLPISRTKIGSITIYLRTDTGEVIPFTEGRTVVTLDFRRVKSLHTY